MIFHPLCAGQDLPVCNKNPRTLPFKWVSFMVRAVDLGKAVNTGRPALQSEGACVRLSRSRPGGVCACVCAHVCMCVHACVRVTHTACVGATSLVIARTGALVAAADGCEPAVKQGRGPAGGSGRDFVVALSVSVTPLLPPAFAPFTPWQPFCGRARFSPFPSF